MLRPVGLALRAQPLMAYRSSWASCQKPYNNSSADLSSRKRCCISRQVDDVLVGELCDDAFHQRGVGARVGAGLEIVKLSHHVDRVDVGQTRNVAQPLQMPIGSVALSSASLNRMRP